MNVHEISIIGLNAIPGHHDNQGVNRSVLAGLLGIVLVVNTLCAWAGLSSGAILEVDHYSLAYIAQPLPCLLCVTYLLGCLCGCPKARL
jgi:hypothetical protein